MATITVTGMRDGVLMTATAEVDDAAFAAAQAAVAAKRAERQSVPSLQDQITNLTNALVEQGALPLQAAQGLGIAAVTGIVAAPLV